MYDSLQVIINLIKITKSTNHEPYYRIFLDQLENNNLLIVWFNRTTEFKVMKILIEYLNKITSNSHDRE